MTTNLTNEQRNDLQQHGFKPVPVVDPVTNEVYFLVSSAMFERFNMLFESDPSEIQETESVRSASTVNAGWDDPAMDVYDNYDANKR
jgi:hypothetical protein